MVTGSRAEFGLLCPLMQRMRDDADIELRIVVTGTHLAPEFGNTFQEILDVGLPIDECVEMLLSSDTPVGVTTSLGLAVIGFAGAFARLAPDLVVLLGDRFEILGAAQAALIARIPVAHIHGGETTEGAIDEAFRHSITKMSYIHFVATERYRDRVIQLGEAPERVFTVGAMSLDGVERDKLLTREQLADSLGCELSRPLFSVTYHPVTLAGESPESSVKQLLSALAAFPEASIVFTGVNSDPRGRIIRDRIRGFVAEAPGRRIYVDSLGHHRYLSLLGVADACVGNSSSGLIEAPSLGTPTVNIGARQRGRIRGPTVIDVVEEAGAIAAAIRYALDPSFKEEWPEHLNPYSPQSGDASDRIHQVIKDAELPDGLIKRFHDV